MTDETTKLGMQSPAALGSARWVCPFCAAECDPKWDCQCGARAVNSALWPAPDRPLMSDKSLSYTAVALAIIGQVPMGSIRVMRQNTKLTGGLPAKED